MTHRSRPLADRAGIILIKDGAVLLMHRIKHGHEFYCIPGGHIDPGETPEHAALRELKEETTLDVQGPLELFMQLTNHGRTEYYFLAPAGFSGMVELDGEEKERNQPDNSYELRWISVFHLPALTLHPQELHAKLCQLNLEL